MVVQSADALVLRTYRYGEADRIVVFLTEDRGKRRGVAPNATVSRRRFGAALEPLTRGRATYVERETRDLVRLERIEVAASPLAATTGRDPDAAIRGLAMAAYVAELLDEWAPEAQPNARLFRLGAAVGDALGRGGSIEALTRYFEYWLLRLEGVYPALARCPRCREPFRHGAVLDAIDRTFVCAGCGQGDVHVSPAAMTFLASLAGRTPDAVTAEGGPAGALRELEYVHHRLIAMHLDRSPRSARVVKELGPHS